MVLQFHTQNLLILQAKHHANRLTEKACFCGRMALWHQITRILSKPPVGHLRCPTRAVYRGRQRSRGDPPQGPSAGGVLVLPEHPWRRASGACHTTTRGSDQSYRCVEQTAPTRRASVGGVCGPEDQLYR